MRSKITPILSWSTWAGVLSLVMGVVTRHHLLVGFRVDETGMSAVIAALFVAGLVVSFLAAKQLHDEWGTLQRIRETHQLPAGKGNDLASVFQTLEEHKRNGRSVDIHAAIDTYHARHNSRVRSVSIMAALAISMGLLGTVVGLIMSISGLGGMVENIGLSRATMMEALKTTVAGMGTAFYTTFFGALAGLVLRAVAVSQLNSLSELCTSAAEYADANLNTLGGKEDELGHQVSKVAESFAEMQKEIESITARLGESFETTMGSFGEVMGAAGSHAQEATQEAFDSLNDSVKQASDAVAGSLADFKLSVDGTSDELKDAVSQLHAAIGQATGEMVTMAQAKLDTEAAEIAGQLSLAADSIQKFLQQKAGETETSKRVA
jgi:hypothetical protein